MTLFGPDVSGFQRGLQLLPRTVFAAAKATEGTGYVDSTYADFKAQAARVGALFWAYHFLRQGNGAAQAAHAYAIVGKTPLMLDWEPERDAAGNLISQPTFGDALAFIDAYTRLGGRVWSTYLPHWYWSAPVDKGGLGSPPLAPIAQRGLSLISSGYTAYSDTGPGWAAYGGMTPALWQYTDSQPYGGQSVDFNAYRGTLAELAALVNGAHAPQPTAPTPKDHDMILHAVTGIPEIWALSGSLYWHVVDQQSAAGYRSAGVPQVTITLAEHTAILTAAEALKNPQASVTVAWPKSFTVTPAA
jgi:hypothetical protein